MSSISSISSSSIADEFGPRTQTGEYLDCSPMVRMIFESIPTPTSGRESCSFRRSTIRSIGQFVQRLGEFLLRSGVNGHRPEDGLEWNKEHTEHAEPPHSIQARWPAYCIPRTIWPPHEMIGGSHLAVIQGIYETIAQEIAPRTIPVELTNELQQKRIVKILFFILTDLLSLIQRSTSERNVRIASTIDLWMAMKFSYQLRNLFGYLDCTIDGFPLVALSPPITWHDQSTGGGGGVGGTALGGVLNDLTWSGRAGHESGPKTFLYALPPYTDAIQTDLENGIGPMKELNKSSWYQDATKLKQVAVELADGTRTPSSIDRALSTYQLRPLQFYGLRHFHPSSIFSDSDSGSRDALVAFSVTDDAEHEWEFLVEYNSTKAGSAMGHLHSLVTGMEFGRIRQPVTGFKDERDHQKIQVCVDLPSIGLPTDTCETRSPFIHDFRPQERAMMSAQSQLFEAQMKDLEMEQEEDAFALNAFSPPPLLGESSTSLEELHYPQRLEKRTPEYNFGLKSFSGAPLSQSTPPPPQKVRDVCHTGIHTAAWNGPMEDRGNKERYEQTMKKTKQKFVTRQIERAVGAALTFTEFSRWGPSLYAKNHPPAAVREFNAQFLDAAMSATGLIPLPKVLLQLIGEYHSYQLPFLPDEAKAQMSSFPLVPRLKSCYAGHNTNPVELIQRSSHPDALFFNKTNRTIIDYRSKMPRVCDDYESGDDDFDTEGPPRGFGKLVGAGGIFASSSNSNNGGGGGTLGLGTAPWNSSQGGKGGHFGIFNNQTGKFGGGGSSSTAGAGSTTGDTDAAIDALVHTASISQTEEHKEATIDDSLLRSPLEHVADQ